MRFSPRIRGSSRAILGRFREPHRAHLHTLRMTTLTKSSAKMQFDRRLYQALLRNDLRAFTEKVFRTLNPGEMFVWNWYIDAIAWHLELVRRGEIKRLIINMPPRS